MRIALLNSGLGLLAAAASLHRLRPDTDLVLSMDPDGMPWGARTPDDIARRSLGCARAAAAFDPDVLVFACNTGSVHALGALREEFEPGIPVVGTVPAIKPAAAFSDMVAIWATVATTGSAYQRNLITEFAASAQVAEVACAGLADAIHAGDEAATRAAVSDAAARTPAGCRAIVLGCTEYELAAGLISAALPGVALFGSATAVAAQALRRAGADGSGPVLGTAQLAPRRLAPRRPEALPARAASARSSARLAAAPGHCRSCSAAGQPACRRPRCATRKVASSPPGPLDRQPGGPLPSGPDWSGSWSYRELNPVPAH